LCINFSQRRFQSRVDVVSRSIQVDCVLFLGTSKVKSPLKSSSIQSHFCYCFYFLPAFLLRQFLVFSIMFSLTFLSFAFLHIRHLCLSVCLPVSLSGCLSRTSLLLCMSASMHACMYACQEYQCMSPCLSLCLFFLSVCLSAGISVCQEQLHVC